MSKDKSNIVAILAERGNSYGSFDGHAVITQGIKMVMDCDWDNLQSLLDSLRKHGDPTPDSISTSSSQQDALDMIAHKIGRIINGNPHYKDSWVDIAGYAQLVVDELEARESSKVEQASPDEQSKGTPTVEQACPDEDTYSLEVCPCEVCDAGSIAVTVFILDAKGKEVGAFRRDLAWTKELHSMIHDLAPRNSKDFIRVTKHILDLRLRGLIPNEDTSYISNIYSFELTEYLVLMLRDFVDYCGTADTARRYLEYTNGKYPRNKAELVKTLRMLAPSVPKEDNLSTYFDNLMENLKKQSK